MILPGVGGWGKFENSMLKQMQMNATLSQNGTTFKQRSSNHLNKTEQAHL
jgi:hypothetical protein